MSSNIRLLVQKESMVDSDVPNRRVSCLDYDELFHRSKKTQHSLVMICLEYRRLSSCR